MFSELTETYDVVHARLVYDEIAVSFGVKPDVVPGLGAFKRFTSEGDANIVFDVFHADDRVYLVRVEPDCHIVLVGGCLSRVSKTLRAAFPFALQIQVVILMFARVGKRCDLRGLAEVLGIPHVGQLLAAVCECDAVLNGTGVEFSRNCLIKAGRTLEAGIDWAVRVRICRNIGECCFSLGQ